MSKFFPLIKVQFLSLFGINKIANKKKGKSAGFLSIGAVALFFGALVCGIAYLYARMFAETYLLMGKPELFLPSMFALASVVCLVLSFYTASGNIYLTLDHDLLSAMPIKTHVVVLSKLIFSYLADLIFFVLILVSSIIVQFDLIGALSIETLVKLFVITLFAPAFPMIISVILGVIVSFISSKFKRKALAQSIIYALIFIGVYALALIGTDMADTLGAIRKIYFIYPLVEKAIYKLEYSVIFCAISLAVLSVAIFIVCKTYDKLNTILKSVKRAKNFKLKTYQKKSQFKVLVQKEFKLLFSHAIYFMNTLMGSFFAIVGAVVIIILGAQEPMLVVLLSVVLQALFAFSFMISPTTAVSISVEGASFYIMRSSPISAKKLLNAKLFVNFIVGVIPAIICAVAISISMIGAPIWQIILTFLTIPLYPILGGNLGLLFNLLFPMMKWDNIQKAVKNGTSLLLTVFSGMIIAGGVFAFLFFVNIDVQIKLLIIFILLSVLSVLTYLLIIKKGEKWLIEKT